MAEPRLRYGRIGTPEGVVIEDETGVDALTVKNGTAAAAILDRGGTEYNVFAGFGVQPTYNHLGQCTNPAALVAAARLACGRRGIVRLPAGVTYLAESTVIVDGNFNGLGAEILWEGDGEAVCVQPPSGESTLWDAVVQLPDVTQITRTWAGSDYGVVIDRANSCSIRIGRVTNFSRGLFVAARGAAGNVYNDYFIQQLRNNKVNLWIEPGLGGWCNENNFFGGRYAHFSEMGTGIADCHHIYIGYAGEQFSKVDNNVWYKPSVEGNAPLHHVYISNAQANTIINGRYEGANVVVRFDGPLAADNLLIGGINNWTVEIQEVNGARWNRLIGRAFRGSAPGAQGGLFVGSASAPAGDDHPIFTVTSPGTGFGDSPAESWRWQQSARYTRWRSAGDVHPRLQIDAALGRIQGGSGSVSPPLSLRPSNNNRWLIEGGNLALNGGEWDSEHLEIGPAHLFLDGDGRPRLKTSGAPNSAVNGYPLGAFWPRSNTAGRPSLPAGIVQAHFDDTLGIPIWWTGTQWVDAMGNQV